MALIWTPARSEASPQKAVLEDLSAPGATHDNGRYVNPRPFPPVFNDLAEAENRKRVFVSGKPARPQPVVALTPTYGELLPRRCETLRNALVLPCGGSQPRTFPQSVEMNKPLEQAGRMARAAGESQGSVR